MNLATQQRELEARNAATWKREFSNAEMWKRVFSNTATQEKMVAKYNYSSFFLKRPWLLRKVIWFNESALAFFCTLDAYGHSSTFRTPWDSSPYNPWFLYNANFTSQGRFKEKRTIIASLIYCIFLKSIPSAPFIFVHSRYFYRFRAFELGYTQLCPTEYSRI
jgi:hypothetical protein